MDHQRDGLDVSIHQILFASGAKQFPTWRAVGTGLDTGATTSWVVPTPTNVADDLLLCFLNARNGTTTFTQASWTNIMEFNYPTSAPNRTISIWRRISNGSEPASYTFTAADSLTGVAVMCSYDGVNTTSPISAEDGQSNESDTAVTAPSINTVQASTLLVFAAAAGVINRTFTPPSSPRTFDERYDANGSNGSLEIADLPFGGTTGLVVATISGAAANNAGAIIALAPE